MHSCDHSCVALPSAVRHLSTWSWWPCECGDLKTSCSVPYGTVAGLNFCSKHRHHLCLIIIKGKHWNLNALLLAHALLVCSDDISKNSIRLCQHFGFFFTFSHFIDWMYWDRSGWKIPGCLSVCVSVCVCVCLITLERQNYRADFNETYHKWSPICLVVCV